MTREDLSHQLKGECSNETRSGETRLNLSLPVCGAIPMFSFIVLMCALHAPFHCFTCRLITPSGLTSIPAGMETPDMIQLRFDYHDHTCMKCGNTYHLKISTNTQKEED